MRKLKAAVGADAADNEAKEAIEIAEVADNFQFNDAHFAAGDCRDAMLEIIKRAANWSAMKESAQRDIIASVSLASGVIVTKIARAINSEGRPEYEAELKKLVVKDGLELTLKGPFELDSVDLLAKAQGGKVLVIMKAAAAYDNARGPAAYDKDQASLIPDGDIDLVAAADPAMGKVVRVESTGDLKVVHADSGVDLGEPTASETEAFLAAEDAARRSGGLAEGERINLKSGMIERVVGQGVEDVRDATPEELAAERERVADFEPVGA
jgi:hypothetical protein